ncbi:MAG: hypothetical protein J6D29_00505 [Solobacterium sp.]|nr:hypothetical protein [Solobacterium sp.]
MKKATVKRLASIVGLSILLVGCTTKPSTETQEAGTGTANVVGGWTVYEDNAPQLTSDEQKRFEEALEGLTGVGYTPIQVLASQLVSGNNYAYLAKGTTVTAQPKTSYYVVVIYEDLQGKKELKTIKEIDLADIKVLDNKAEGLLGGWQVPADRKGSLPQEASASFEKATQKLMGVSLNPLALLGTQVVSGTNYIAICEGTTTTQNPTPALYVLKWYEDLQKNVEVLDNSILDLEYYVTE